MRGEARAVASGDHPVTDPLRLLDTGALLTYAEQSSPLVGYELIKCEESQRTLLVSAACLAEAYELASDDGVHLLDALVNLEPIRVEPVNPDDARVTGLVARRVGRLGLAHTCMLAMASALQVMTTDADAALKVLEESMVKRLD